MQKVTFNAEIKVPKLPKGTSAQLVTEARAKGLFVITIKGTFTAEEAGTLELLLKSWHQDPAKK